MQLSHNIRVHEAHIGEPVEQLVLVTKGGTVMQGTTGTFLHKATTFKNRIDS